MVNRAILRTDMFYIGVTFWALLKSIHKTYALSFYQKY